MELLSGDFHTLHGVLTGLGALLAIYATQLTSSAHQDQDDPEWLQWLNRFGYFFLAIMFLWSFASSTSQGWYPFRPGIGVVAAIDFMLVLRSVTLWASIHRQRGNGSNGGKRRFETEPFSGHAYHPLTHAGTRDHDEKPRTHH